MLGTALLGTLALRAAAQGQGRTVETLESAVAAAHADYLKRLAQQHPKWEDVTPTSKYPAPSERAQAVLERAQEVQEFMKTHPEGAWAACYDEKP